MRIYEFTLHPLKSVFIKKNAETFLLGNEKATFVQIYITYATNTDGLRIIHKFSLDTERILSDPFGAKLAKSSNFRKRFAFAD